MAVENEDVNKITKFKKTLNSISKDINNSGGDSYGSISIGIGFDGLTASISDGVINNIKNKFGIRSLLNQQIVSPKGKKSLKKLFRLFDVNNTNLALEIENHLNTKRI